MSMIPPHPHDVRLQARQAHYPNSLTEEATLRQIDDAVNDKVRLHERYLVQEARKLIDNSGVDEEAASSIITQLAEEVRYPLIDGGEPTTALAERYEQLRALAAQARQSLQRAEQDADFLAAKSADPYASLMKLYTKWPMIRPIL